MHPQSTINSVMTDQPVLKTKKLTCEDLKILYKRNRKFTSEALSDDDQNDQSVKSPTEIQGDIEVLIKRQKLD